MKAVRIMSRPSDDFSSQRFSAVNIKLDAGKLMNAVRRAISLVIAGDGFDA